MPTTRPKRRRRLAIAALVAVLAVGLAAAGMNANVESIGSTGVRASVPALDPAPVAIVLGAGLRTDGTPSDALADRLTQAVELYRMRKVLKLLLSGDHGADDHDEVNGMRRWVVEHGVAPQDVFCDHAGFSTWETFARARGIFGVERAIVVTQEFHLERALFTAAANGIEAEGVPCDARTYVNATRYEMREFGSRCKAWLQSHGLLPSSSVGGEPISIDGDGRKTWD